MNESESPQLAILVLSCDKYSDLWDDFFNLKERYWPDCPYHTYLATDSVDYQRKGVDVIHFGKIRTWTICAQNALRLIPEPYIALFLEDAFIYKEIETSIIESDLDFVVKHNVDYLTLERNRKNKSMTESNQEAPHIWRIDKHKKYGIDTSAAIWKKTFFQKELAMDDCDAWQFEVNYCIESQSDEGLKGEIYFDERKPFNISPVEVVRLGKLTPSAIRFFKSQGYDIRSEREKMSEIKSSVYDFRMWLKNHSFLSMVIKRIALLFGVKFFTKF